MRNADLRMLRAMRTRGHTPEMEKAAKALGRAGNNGAVWVVLGVVLALLDPSRREAWLICAALGPIAIGLNYGIKLLVKRPRPVLEGLPPLGGAPSSLSFPSAHATSSFAVATAMIRVDPATAVASRRRPGPLARPSLPRDALPVRRPGRRLARRRPRPDRSPLAMKVGIVGLPNAGKSTLFNALTKGGAQTGDYPFTTIEPNVAIAQVPDERLERVAETVRSSELVPATISFHDIAGLVKGRFGGEGLGNKFLASIRETDAICHVVRCHEDSGVPHPDGRVDPLADIETIETELLLSDFEQVERRLERVGKQAKTGDAEAIAERGWLEAVRDAIAAGRPARSVPVPDAAPDAPRLLQALTSKPILYVANVDEGDAEAPEAVAAHAAAVGAGVVAVSARIEGELAELDPAEAEEMRESYGVEGSGLARLVRSAYDLLELITFFTAGEDNEAVARPLHRGATAWEAAGTIHTEIQDAFVKAEAIGWEELVECGGYSQARDRGLLRIEGRDYVVADGDVITIKV